MLIKKTYIFCILACGIGLTTAALGHSGATGIVKKRMDSFTKSKENLKAIRNHVKKKDFDAILPLAEEILSWAVKIPDHFPEGSDGKPSMASPDIWSDFSDFTNAATTHTNAAKKLVLAAKSDDLKKVIESLGLTSKTCKSCHETYRLD